jgi:MscS family membrane protein
VSKPHKYILFPKQLPQVYVVKIGNSWYFSGETVNEIEHLYADVYPWHSQWIHTLIPKEGELKFLNIELWQLFSMGIIAVSFLILYYIFSIILTMILRKVQMMIFHKTDQNIKIALKQFARPIIILILINLIEKIIPSLLFHVDVNYVLILAINIVSTVFWVYVFLNLVKVLMIFYEDYTLSSPSKLDDQLVPVLRNFLKGIVIFVGFLKLLTDFGLDPTTVIAGASIGGIAIAFASQDTVKNLIGTFMIFLDKPFHIGDWIVAEGVEGTVEEVGFRSTRIRAFDTSIFQIPNSKLAEIVVNNKGLRHYRRYKTELGLRYDTPPELIEAFVKGVREIVILHPDTLSEEYNVEFTNFGSSSLIIMLNVFFKQLDWNVEQSSRHRLHIAIVKLAKELGVEFAFPATTVIIEQFPEKTGRNLKYDLSDERIKKAIKNVMEDFKKGIN